MCPCVGRPGRCADAKPRPVAGLARVGAVSGAGEIKREEKEDEENTSAADNSEEEKKELKPPRPRTRCPPPRSSPQPARQDARTRTQTRTRPPQPTAAPHPCQDAQTRTRPPPAPGRPPPRPVRTHRHAHGAPPHSPWPPRPSGRTDTHMAPPCSPWPPGPSGRPHMYADTHKGAPPARRDAQTRTRCPAHTQPPAAPPVGTHAHARRHAHGAHRARLLAGPPPVPPPHCLPLAPRARPIARTRTRTTFSPQSRRLSGRRSAGWPITRASGCGSETSMRLLRSWGACVSCTSTVRSPRPNCSSCTRPCRSS